ncbi:MAG: hypothetical protein CM15mP8_2570 [Methanobacteriota archaeon]|nr:MAG: hypothetical protein CM15mP8_2570 [Euryarchaeota archaeon]
MIGLVMMWDLFGSLDYAVVFDEANIAAVAAESSGTLQWALGMMFIGAKPPSSRYTSGSRCYGGPTQSALIQRTKVIGFTFFRISHFCPEYLQNDLVDQPS